MPDNKTKSTRTALVTGAARRIGNAIASSMAQDGWQVIIHYNTSDEDASALARELRSNGGLAETVQCDLSDPVAQTELIQTCSDRGIIPTCIINNASSFWEDHPEDLSPDVWDRHLNTNLRAPIFLASGLAKVLPKDQDANVINIIDQRVLRPRPEFFSYTISKSALLTATQTLAQSLAPRIRVNAIAPGPVLQSIHQSPEDFAEEVAATLLQRACSLEEIQAAVRFILNSPSMTGQMITLDSGQHLT
ncbi:MAG: SDR family oxidoreductase [Filomicrobium sp.]